MTDRAMTLWRLEWLRLIRSRRWLALVAVYLFFGLLGPFTARYMGEIVARFGGGIEVTLPDPTPADGITQFVANAAQIGLLVVIVVSAGALCLDATPEIGTFFRTRVASFSKILAPRFLVTSGAVLAAFAAGTLAAWYETVVLLGDVPAGRLLVGWLLGALYLVFAVAVVAAVAGRSRSVLATVFITVLILLGLPILGAAPAVGEWLPSRLVGALDGLVRGEVLSEYVPAVVSTVVATAVALRLSILWGSRREI